MLFRLKIIVLSGCGRWVGCSGSLIDVFGDSVWLMLWWCRCSGLLLVSV